MSDINVTVTAPSPIQVKFPATQGVAGPPGAQGPAGPAGPAGSASTYVFNQISAASVWTITHNLNRFPSVTVVDSANDEVEGDLVYLSANSLRLNFSAPFSGEAYLN